jgi:hypothetical protein
MFQDTLTLILALYVGCHMFYTTSYYFNKFYNNVSRQVTQVTNDIHTISESIQSVSNTVRNVSYTLNESNRTTEQHRNTGVIVLCVVYALIVCMYSGVDIMSIVRSLASLFTQRYFARQTTGASANMSPDMASEMQSILTRMLMEQMTGHPTTQPTSPSDNLRSANSFNDNLRSANSFNDNLRSTARSTRLSESDSDTESDITDVVDVDIVNVAESVDNYHETDTVDQATHLNEQVRPSLYTPTSQRSERGDSVETRCLSDISNMVVVNGQANLN